MGRKKKKVDVSDEPEVNEPLVPPPPAAPAGVAVIGTKASASASAAPASSSYATTSHSAEIIDEDIYVSDGSEDSDDGEPIELVLAGSRMGLMRRGIHHQMLVSFVCTQVLICDVTSQTRVYLFMLSYSILGTTSTVATQGRRRDRRCSQDRGRTTRRRRKTKARRRRTCQIGPSATSCPTVARKATKIRRS